MAEDGKFIIEKFNGRKYQLWKMKMEDYIYYKYLFLPLGGIEKMRESMKDEEWEVLDRKAPGTRWFLLATSVPFNISKEMTMTYLMNALAKMYEKISSSNNVFLMKHLFDMKMSKGGSVVDHFNDFSIVTSQLCFVGVTTFLMTLGIF